MSRTKTHAPVLPKLTAPQKEAMSALKSNEAKTAWKVAAELGRPNAITTSRPLKQLVRLSIAIRTTTILNGRSFDAYLRGPLWGQAARQEGITFAVDEEKSAARLALEDQLWQSTDPSIAGYSRIVGVLMAALSNEQLASVVQGLLSRPENTTSIYS